jgi:hypothetical protein
MNFLLIGFGDGFALGSPSSVPNANRKSAGQL